MESKKYVIRVASWKKDKICVWIWGLLAFYLIFPLWGNSEKTLQEADMNYQRGEKATTYEERKLAFNRALFLYNILEKDLKIQSIYLDQALANTYFQLGEYAWAILYYQRALKKSSSNALLLSHLKQAEQRLSLPSIVDQGSSIASFFTISEKFEWLFWAIFIVILTLSCALWLPFLWFRYLAIGCTIILFLLMNYLLLAYYLTPLEGILIKSTALYRSPNWNQSQLTNQPLLEGSKVKILGMTNLGDWLKIESSVGIIGYIPTANLRPI